MHRIALGVLLCVCFTTPVSAQTVYVVDNNGVETKGFLRDLGPATLTIATAEGPRQFDLATQVISVHRDGDSVKSGVVIGAVILGTLGGLYALGEESCGPGMGGIGGSRPCTLREAAILVGGGAAIGAGIGLAIDALHHGRTRIYPSATRHSASAVVTSTW